MLGWALKREGDGLGARRKKRRMKPYRYPASHIGSALDCDCTISPIAVRSDLAVEPRWFYGPRLAGSEIRPSTILVSFQSSRTPQLYPHSLSGTENFWKLLKTLTTTAENSFLPAIHATRKGLCSSYTFKAAPKGREA